MPRFSRRIREPATARASLASPLRSSARMDLSRFVVAYHDVRPGEHVLYSVLHDRYVGIDSHTLEAIDRWSAGHSPANRDERETPEGLVDDGFLVRTRAEDDANLRTHLDRAADGIAGTMHITLMPTL